MAKVKLPSFKQAIKKVKQEGQALEIAHNMLQEQNIDVRSLADTMTRGLPKASLSQALQSVLKGMNVTNDPTKPQEVKAATELAVGKIVANSDFVELANKMDENLGQQVRDTLQNIQNQR